MKSAARRFARVAGGLGLGLSAALWSAAASSQELMGQPTPKGIGLQPAASPLKHEAHFFHDAILLPIIVAISLFVLGLLIWVAVRYNSKSNPVPAKWSHNTVIEVIWTAVPVLILMFIAIFSFKLLFAYHDMPKPYMTVKVTGYQWYWGYEYPDNGIGEQTSVMLSEADARAQNVPYRLAADTSLVVPVNQTVRVLVTGADVIHNFALPAFGLKTDAVPGRVNETWFRAERPGIYYGQCSELCGVDHAFMPIQIQVLPQAQFDAWVASKNGTPVGAAQLQNASTGAPATAAAEPPVNATADAPAAAAPSGTAAPGTTPAAGAPAAAAGAATPGPLTPAAPAPSQTPPAGAATTPQQKANDPAAAQKSAAAAPRPAARAAG